MVFEKARVRVNLYNFVLIFSSYSYYRSLTVSIHAASHLPPFLSALGTLNVVPT